MSVAAHVDQSGGGQRVLTLSFRQDLHHGLSGMSVRILNDQVGVAPVMPFYIQIRFRVTEPQMKYTRQLKNGAIAFIE